MTSARSASSKSFSLRISNLHRIALLIVLATIALAIPARANTLSAGGITLSGTTGQVNYMGYPSPNDLEAFINTYGPITPGSPVFALNGYLPMTVTNGSAVGSLFGSNVNISFSDIDSMPAAQTPSGTLPGDPIIQPIGGTGTFSLVYGSGLSTYTLTASTAGDQITGNLGGTTADIDLYLCNFSDNDPGALATLVVSQLNTLSSCSSSASNHVYVDVSGSLVGGTLSEVTCLTFLCTTPGEQYLNSFDLDLSMSIGTTAPGSGSGSGSSPTPEPSSLLLLGSGLIGTGFSLRRALNLRRRAS